MIRARQHLLTALPSVAAMAVALTAGCSSPQQPQLPAPQFDSGIAATPGMSGGASVSETGPMTMTPTQTHAAQALPAGPNAVDIEDFAFAPATLTVKAGSTVTWANHDDDPHTVVAANGTFRSPAMGSGGTYTFTFAAAGTYDYICSIHPFMRGTVVVTP